MEHGPRTALSYSPLRENTLKQVMKVAGSYGMPASSICRSTSFTLAVSSHVCMTMLYCRPRHPTSGELFSVKRTTKRAYLVDLRFSRCVQTREDVLQAFQCGRRLIRHFESAVRTVKGSV